MPRSNRVLSPDYPYQLTARCINRDWFEQPMAEVWPIFCDHLYFFAKAYEVDIFSFVLMQNHFHLLARFPQNNLSKAMSYLMRETSRQIGKNANRINYVYGARFHSSLITNELYFRNAYKYNYRNPCSAGIVQRVEQYRYSTLPGLLGMQPLYIPIVEDLILFDDLEKSIHWLNTKPDSDHEKEFRLALRRPTIQFALNRKNKKESIWEKKIL